MIKLERRVWIYIGLLLLATYSIQFVAIANGGEDWHLFTLFIGFSMFFPGIGALIYLWKTKQGAKYIDWKLRTPFYLLVSLVLPAVLTLIGIACLEALGLGTNYAYYLVDGQVKDIEMPLLLGTEPQSPFFFLVNFVLTGVGFALLSSLLAIGEEVGWRGFLQKKLLEQNGLFRSVVFLGLLWGFWHFPLIVTGFNYPEYPLLGAFLIFPLMTVFISFFFGWLSIGAGSVWPAIFAHGGFNSIMVLLFELDFGPHKLAANFLILGGWMLIGLASYGLLSARNRNSVSG